MDARHARYPFLDAAREAVEQAGVSLADLIAADRDRPAVERGRERVERALVAGTVEPDRRIDPRTELLSYPVARVIVSLLDAPGAVEKYAAAEAATASERFTEEFRREGDADRQATLGAGADAGAGAGRAGGDAPSGDGFTVEAFLREFGLDDAVLARDDEYRVAVAEYLRLAPDGEAWRLAVRELSDGRVTVTRGELSELLRSAVERRVADGLPLSVPPAVADPLEPTVEAVASRIAGADYPRSFDAEADPAAFPPCVRALLERVREEESLPPRSRFSLAAFLAAAGLDEEGIASLCGRDADGDGRFAYALDRLVGDGSYPPPSCETMQAYGDCVNRDDLCARIDHPLEYYAARLDEESERAAD